MNAEPRLLITNHLLQSLLCTMPLKSGEIAVQTSRTVLALTNSMLAQNKQTTHRDIDRVKSLLNLEDEENGSSKVSSKECEKNLFGKSDDESGKDEKMETEESSTKKDDKEIVAENSEDDLFGDSDQDEEGEEGDEGDDDYEEEAPQVNVNKRDFDDLTPLHLAIINQRPGEYAYLNLFLNLPTSYYHLQPRV